MIGGSRRLLRQAAGIAIMYFVFIVSVHSFCMFFTQSGIDKFDGMVDDTSMSLPYILLFFTRGNTKGLALRKCVTDFSNKAVVQLVSQINCILR